MDVRNDTPFEVGFAIGLGPDGGSCLAVIVKATYTIPPVRDAAPAVADEQHPLVTADEFYKGDVTGSLRLEAENVPFKPRADIVLVGTAYTPGRRAARSVDVLLQVGRLRKALRVFGDRQWVFPTKAVMIPIITEAEPFTEMPLVYERAFGGFDRKAGKWCDKNYVGRGLLGKKTRDSVDGKLLPNIEDPTRPIRSWDDEPDPVGYGYYSPTWQPRVRYGGTEEGLEQPHPIFGLAADFRHDYYNGAHPDLQVSGYLQGNELVELLNLTPDGPRRFRLPGVRPAVTVHRHAEQGDEPTGDGMPAEAQDTQAVPLEAPLDTLVLLPDDGVFCLLWRARYPLQELEAGMEAVAAVDVVLDETGGAERRGVRTRRHGDPGSTPGQAAETPGQARGRRGEAGYP